MRYLLLAILFSAFPALALSQDLSGSGAFDAVTINGFTFPVTDVQTLQQAGILRLNPETRHFAFAPDITSERALQTRLRPLNLSRPTAPSDLYLAAKVTLPNAAAHELTVPSGFGPAHFANQPGSTTVSASLGGVNRVPYTTSPDGALGFGLSFGNAFHGLGASISMSLNDLNHLGNGQRISWGFDLSHYVADGLSLALDGENLFARFTDGEASYSLAGSWAFDRRQMPFKGVLTLGAGTGRFAHATERDIFEGRAAHATGLFGALSYEVNDHFNLITEWNGRNLNAGLGYVLPRSGISLKLGLEDLTRHSGNGPILTGSVGATLIRF